MSSLFDPPGHRVLAAPAAAARTLARVRGGDVRRAALAAALTILLAAPVRGATVNGTVRLDGEPARDAVVYLERVDGPVARPAPARAVIDQKNLAFLPRVLPVVQGTTVEFTRLVSWRSGTHYPAQGVPGSSQDPCPSMRRAGARGSKAQAARPTP
jgi:hypothetical protein